MGSTQSTWGARACNSRSLFTAKGLHICSSQACPHTANPCMDLNPCMSSHQWQDNRCTASVHYMSSKHRCMGNPQCMRSSLHMDKLLCIMEKIASAKAFQEDKLPWPRLEGWLSVRQECILLAIWMKLVALWKVLANGLVVQLKMWGISWRRHLTIFSDVDCEINANRLIRIHHLQCKVAHDRCVQASHRFIYVRRGICASIGVFHQNVSV